MTKLQKYLKSVRGKVSVYDDKLNKSLDVMKQREYTRLKNLLSVIAERRKTVGDNMLEAEKRFAAVEKAIAELLISIKKRTSES